MPKLDSTFYGFYYRLKKLFSVKNAFLPHPITWGESKLIPPSTSFYNDLKDIDKRRMDMLVKEADLISKVHCEFPNVMNDKHWEKLMETRTRKERINLFKFLRKKEKQEKTDLEKKLKRRASKNANPLPPVNNNNNISTYISPSFDTSERWEEIVEDGKLYQNFICNETPQIAVDCRFIPYLSERAQNLTAIQLAYMISENRRCQSPWPLHLVNFDLENKVLRECKRKHLGVLDNERKISAFVTEKNYTEVFDPKKLIYLSPDAEELLTTIEVDHTYIIGGIVDRVAESGIPRYASLEMSQCDGIKAMRLPINENVKWETGKQFLTLVTVMKMLQNAFENDGNWKETMEKYIPKRHIIPVEEKRAEPKLQQHKHAQFDAEVLRILEENLGKEEQNHVAAG